MCQPYTTMSQQSLLSQQTNVKMQKFQEEGMEAATHTYMCSTQLKAAIFTCRSIPMSPDVRM